MEKRIPRKIAKRVGIFGHSFVAYSPKNYVERLNEFCPSVKFSAHGKGSSGLKWVIQKLKETPKGRYDEAIIHTGVNEIAVFKPKKWEKQLAWMKRNLTKAIRIARRKGMKRIILIEATPWKGYKTWSKEKAEYTLEYNRMLEEFAKAEGVEFVRTYKLMEGENGEMKEGYTEDGLHPNREGLEIITKAIAQTQYPEWIDVAGGKYVPLEEVMANAQKAKEGEESPLVTKPVEREGEKEVNAGEKPVVNAQKKRRRARV